MEIRTSWQFPQSIPVVSLFQSRPRGQSLAAWAAAISTPSLITGRTGLTENEKGWLKQSQFVQREWLPFLHIHFKVPWQWIAIPIVLQRLTAYSFLRSNRVVEEKSLSSAMLLPCSCLQKGLHSLREGSLLYTANQELSICFPLKKNNPET